MSPVAAVVGQGKLACRAQEQLRFQVFLEAGDGFRDGGHGHAELRSRELAQSARLARLTSLEQEVQHYLHRDFDIRDERELRKLFVDYRGEIAAVMLEPAAATEPAPGFLADLRQIGRAHV